MYKIFGYTCDCNDFVIVCESFMEAVKSCKKLEKSLCTVSLFCEDRPVRHY